MNSAATASEGEREDNNRGPAHLNRSRFDGRSRRRLRLFFGDK